jgi:uncharacterized protein
VPRPIRCRRICFAPEVTLFKPAGVPTRYLREVTLSVDELEALRLVDLEGRYQDGAAESMGISRPTLSRILAEGRRKVAEALVGGKALRVDGGEVRLDVGADRKPSRGNCGRREYRSRRCCGGDRRSDSEESSTSPRIGAEAGGRPAGQGHERPDEEEITNHKEDAVEEQ